MYMPSTKIQLSVHLVFDELSEVGKTTKNSMLEFTEPANVEYLKYLENMLYMDGHIIYVTTRAIRQQDLNCRLSSSLFK